MEQFEEGFRELRETVRDGIRDHSLVAGLRKIVEGVRLDAETARGYCEHLFKLYDYSNSSVFITRPPHLKSTEPIVLDPLAIGIKTIVLKMLANLVAFFNDNPAMDLPHSLLYEALEIMVMVSRVLLDLNRSSDVRPVYALVVTFREAVGSVLQADS